MRLSQLRIENFRGLSLVEFKFDQAANVIVGPNAIGKTTVLEAVRLVKAVLMPRYHQEAQQVLTSLGAMPANPQLSRYADLGSLARDSASLIRIQMSLDLSEREVSELASSREQIAMELLRGQLARTDDQGELAMTHFLSSSEGRKKLEATQGVVDKALNAIVAPHALRIDLDIDPSSGRFGAKEPLGPALITILERRCSPHQALFSYFPADRALPTGEANIQIGSGEATHQIQSHLGQAASKYQRLKQTVINNLLLAEVDQTSLKEDFSMILGELLPGKELAGLSLTPVGTLKVAIRESSTGKLFDIDSMSSGEKGLILTLILLRRCLAHGGIALIDEPELHLNPAVCRSIVPFLCDSVIRESDAQLLICTHSSEILGAAFDRADCTVHHLRSHRDSTKIHERDEHEVFEALRRLGTSAAESLFASGSIFVEGEDDVAVLEEGFFEQISGYRITSLGGRNEVEREIRTLQDAESAGELDRLNCFIFDLDRMPANLQSSEFVRVLQWDRYCLENYLIDRGLLYDVLRDRGVDDLSSRGDFERRIEELAMQQLTELIAKEVYRERQSIDPSMRAKDLERQQFDEVSTVMSERLRELKESLDSYDIEAWKESFVEECRARFSDREQEWREGWHKFASGKRLIDDSYRTFSVNLPKRELKRSLVRAMKVEATEDWTLIRSKIRDALGT